MHVARRTAAFLAAALPALPLALAVPPPASALAPGVRIQIDGRELAADPPPVIEQGRTLVPFRAIFEALGASVEWDGATQTVRATAPGRYVRLRIDNRLACLSPDCARAELLDVPAQIVRDRTFVPARFVASALGAAVDWDESARIVRIRTGAGEEAPAVPGLDILTVRPGQRITGVTALQSSVQVPAAAIRYYLLDPETGRGPLLAGGSDVSAAYTWRPDPAYPGRRILAAAAYDAAGRLVAARAVPVEVAVDPTVTVTGIEPGRELTGTGGSVRVAAQFGFVATRVRWELVDPNSGQANLIAEADPYAPFTWWPGVWSNGAWLLRATAFDRTGKAYPSAGVPIRVNMQPWQAIAGVKPGQTVSGPVTLRAQVNYGISRVQFRLADGTVLGEGTGPGAAVRWFPGPDRNGPQTVHLTVWDQAGQAREAEPVPVTVQVSPTLRLLGVGPRQVLTGTVELRAEANVPVSRIEFRLSRPGGAAPVVIAGGTDIGATYRWSPSGGQDGDWQLQAVATGPQGQTLATEAIPVRVHTGPLYGPRPAVPKEQFVDLVSAWAVRTRQETGMSAALQVAQAILETGWGQYVPVDKYTGRFSNNLFGIKGEGPAGSVVSNTKEEYNGVLYPVEDRFRAYGALEESWRDHQDFLLKRERYAPFRAVAADPVQGAWALLRSGYATDSQYARKLIDLMDRYDLYRLDEGQP